MNTNIYDYLKDFSDRMINTEVLGKAFEPEQCFENADGTPIRFDADFFGNHRGNARGRGTVNNFVYGITF